MSRRMFFPVLVLGLSGLVGSVAHADTTAQVRQQIQANYNSQNAAMARKDAQGAVAHMDPAYQGISPQYGTQTYERRVAMLPQIFAISQSIHNTTHIDKLVLHGSTADVRVHISGAITLVNPKTGRLATMKALDTAADTWVKRPSGWMLVRSRVLTIKSGR